MSKLRNRYLIKHIGTERFLAYNGRGLHATKDRRYAFQFEAVDSPHLAVPLATKTFRLVYVWPHQFLPHRGFYQ
jgi:hypothetical protein